MRILIVYGTTDGQTAKVAAAMAGAMRSTEVDVDVANAEAPWDPDPADYGGVIVAASVHAGSYQRAVLRWVQRHHVALATRPAAFVSVCLAVVNRTPKVDAVIRETMQRFFAMTEWQPSETKVVAGALRYRQYNWLKRWMMRRIVAKHGGDTDTSRNYEYTDWRDLVEFAQRFSGSIAPRKEDDHATPIPIDPGNPIRAYARSPR